MGHCGFLRNLLRLSFAHKFTQVDVDDLLVGICPGLVAVARSFHSRFILEADIKSKPMCPKNTYTLRISNRGDGIQALVERKTWTMNLPSCLRSKGACMVTVTHASMESQQGATYAALGLDSNIPHQGADTEQGGQNAGSVQRLASFELTGQRVSYLSQPYSFRCMSLPERMEFTRVAVPLQQADELPTPDANVYDGDSEPYYCEVVMTIVFDVY